MLRLLLLAALVIVVALAVGHVIAALFVPLLWIAVIAASVLLVNRAVRTRHDR